MYIEYFDFEIFKVILRSFGAFLIVDNLVSRRRLAIERNGPKFRHWEYLSYVVYTGYI